MTSRDTATDLIAALTGCAWRLPQVIAYTGLSRTSIYRAVKGGVFPAPVALYGRAVAWDSAAVQAWKKAKFSF